MADFSAGANIEAKHHFGINWERDVAAARSGRPAQCAGRRSQPRRQGHLYRSNVGWKSGHIFQLGQKYAAAMDATVLDEQGKSVVMTMGCYGIGVSRVVAAAIEQNHDDNGIIWPDSIAPFQVALLPMNMHKSQRLREAVEKLHDELESCGI